MRLASILVFLSAACLNDGGFSPFHRSRNISSLVDSAQGKPIHRILTPSNANAMRSNFAAACTTSLTSTEFTGDGILTQIDFASFLLSHCRSVGLCDDSSSLDFEQLSLVLQLKFLRGVCPQDDVKERTDCIRSLEDMWIKSEMFGVRIPEGGVDDGIYFLVQALCVDSYVDVVEMGLTKISVSTHPSTIEVDKPSGSPTNQSFSRSNQPSDSPSPSLSLRDPTISGSNTPSVTSNIQPDSLMPILSSSDDGIFPESPDGPSSNSTNQSSSPDAFQYRSPSTQPSYIPSPIPSLNNLNNLRSNHPSYISSMAPTSHQYPTGRPVLFPRVTFLPTPSSDKTPTPSRRDFLGFVEECKEYLLSPDSRQDGIISQIEFSKFLSYHCISEGLCDESFAIDFEELDISLQLDFILTVCHQSVVVTQSDCTNELERSWRKGIHFGFKVDNDDIENLIEALCANSFDQTVLISSAPSNAPTSFKATSIHPTSHIRSPYLVTAVPSTVPSLSTPNDSDRVGDNASTFPVRSKRAIVAVSTTIGFIVIAVVFLFIHRRTVNGQEYKKSPGEYYSKDSHQHDNENLGRSVLFPFGYISSSPSSSSSSSFRDYRFVPVFGPTGEAIPQFNPNTAAAVVIGSVTIGGSSSISTGPGLLVKDEELASHKIKVKSYIAIGQVTHPTELAKSEAISRNSSELSSLSSSRSSFVQSWHRWNEFHGSTQSRKDRVSKQFRGDVNTTSTSVISRSTMPMSLSKASKLERHAVMLENQTSFADWKAVSLLVAECRDPTNVTDSSAANKQKKFFFDLFTSPESEASDTSNTHSSFHSLTINPLSFKARSDTHSYQVRLQTKSISTQSECTSIDGAESFSSSSNEMPASEVLIPWKRGGFSTSFQLSDGRQSEESACSSQSSAHVDPAGVKNHVSFRPMRYALDHVKSSVERWLNRKNYQNLNGKLHEDLSVISMQSYSSQIHLLPNDKPERLIFGLPGLILGTWAAATIPVAIKPGLASQTLENNEQSIESEDKITSYPKRTVGASSIEPQSAILGISKRVEGNHSYQGDRRVVESNKGWSDPSAIKHIEYSSCCNITSRCPDYCCTVNLSADLDSSIAENTGSSNTANTQDLLSNSANVHKMKFSHILSERTSNENSPLELSTNEVKTLHSNHIEIKSDETAHVVSDSSGSIQSIDILPELKSSSSFNDQHYQGEPADKLPTTVVCNDKNMSTGNLSQLGNNDWSHAVSGSVSSADESSGKDSSDLNIISVGGIGLEPNNAMADDCDTSHR